MHNPTGNADLLILLNKVLILSYWKSSGESNVRFCRVSELNHCLNHSCHKPFYTHFKTVIFWIDLGKFWWVTFAFGCKTICCWGQCYSRKMQRKGHISGSSESRYTITFTYDWYACTVYIAVPLGRTFPVWD